MNEEMRRQRTFTWDDPLATAEMARSWSGLDYLQAIMAGKMPAPPILRLMNMRFEEVAEGRVVVAVEPAEYHYNPIGSVHGGLAATLVDSAMACAIHSTLPAGIGYTTLEFKVNYIRPMTVDTGTVRCMGTTIHVGRRVATAEARLVDDAGKLYAHATTTCLVLE